MKTLKALVLGVALILAACESYNSPTGPAPIDEGSLEQVGPSRNHPDDGGAE